MDGRLARWMVATCLLFGACGSTSSVVADAGADDDPAAAEPVAFTDDAQVVELRQLWSAASIDDYALTVERLCDDCPRSAWTTTVVNGSVAGVVPVAGGIADAMNMEAVFDELIRVVGHEQHSSIVVTADGTTGAVLEWTSTFAPVGGEPRLQGMRMAVDQDAVDGVERVVHGAEAARASCPGVAWTEHSTSGFTVLLPDDLIDSGVEGVDSEIGEFVGDEVQVWWDFGWYSSDFVSSSATSGRSTVDYSGIVGSVIRTLPDAATQSLSVHFPQVSETGGEADLLSLQVSFDEPQRAVAECIVQSIDWR